MASMAFRGSGFSRMGLAVMASYGLAAMLGIVFTPLSGSLPILVLGLGVDDAIAGEFQLQRKDDVAYDTDQMSSVALMQHVGVSIDSVAFAVGFSTVLPGQEARQDRQTDAMQNSASSHCALTRCDVDADVDLDEDAVCLHLTGRTQSVSAAGGHDDHLPQFHGALQSCSTTIDHERAMKNRLKCSHLMLVEFTVPQLVNVIYVNDTDGAIEPDNAQLTQLRGFPPTHTLEDNAKEVYTHT